MGADGLGETSMVRAIWLFNSPDLSLSPLSMFYLCSYLHICTCVHVAVRVKLGCSFASCCPLHVLRQALSLGGWLGGRTLSSLPQCWDHKHQICFTKVWGIKLGSVSSHAHKVFYWLRNHPSQQMIFILNDLYVVKSGISFSLSFLKIIISWVLGIELMSSSLPTGILPAEQSPNSWWTSYHSWRLR